MNPIAKNNPDNDEHIINEMMKDEELSKNTVVINPNISQLRKKEVRDLGVKVTKITLSILILIFTISLFSPWFQLGGKATELGFVRIKHSMADKEYLALSSDRLATYEGNYVVVSPIQLVAYTLQNLDTYKKVYGRQGEETSVFSWLHMSVILTFILVLFLSLVSIILLFIRPSLQWMRMVKISAFINILICCMNFFWLKMAYLNMFVIHAQSVLKQRNLLHAVSITGKGIAENNLFYPYNMSVSNTFLVSLGLLGVWLIVSSVLLEIKRKRDEDLRDIELKAKIKV